MWLILNFVRKQNFCTQLLFSSSPFLQSWWSWESTACWVPSWCLVWEEKDLWFTVDAVKPSDRKSSTHGCTAWWCAGSWAAVVCTRGSSSPGHQTWSWGWSSPWSALPGRRQTSACFPGRLSRDADKYQDKLIHKCGRVRAAASWNSYKHQTQQNLLHVRPSIRWRHAYHPPPRRSSYVGKSTCRQRSCMIWEQLCYHHTRFSLISVILAELQSFVFPEVS